MTYFIGIDVSKRNLVSCITNNNGEAITKKIVSKNNRNGFEKLLMAVKNTQQNKEDVLFGMEHTGNYHLSILNFLENEGYKVVMINPSQSKMFIKAWNNRPIKTDAKDAYCLANYIRVQKYKTHSPENQKLESLKQLSRHRTWLTEQQSDLKRKVKAVLLRTFPEYEGIFSDIFGVTSFEILNKYPLPSLLLRVKEEEIADFIKKVSKGTVKNPQEKAATLFSAAKDTVGCSSNNYVYSFEMKNYLGQIKLLSEQIQETDTECNNLLGLSNTYVTSIPGIGTVLGSAIVGEIGDISRFSKSSKLVAFAGFDPKVNESGEFVGTRNEMSKRGSSHLRRAIWLAANIAYLHDSVLHQYYTSLRNRGKHHYVAITAVARKLCKIIFAILSEYRLFIPGVVPSNSAA